MEVFPKKKKKKKKKKRIDKNSALWSQWGSSMFLASLFPTFTVDG